MPRLLVSVRNSEEAAVALAAVVDLIDVKEPRSGSLGAATVDVIDGVLRLVNGHRPVSVALGELVDSAAIRAINWPHIAANFLQCSRKSGWRTAQTGHVGNTSFRPRLHVLITKPYASRSPMPT